MTDLAHARAVIEAESCKREDNWCRTHEYHWSLNSSECAAVPDSLDVARDLLAAVERVETRADSYRDRAAVMEQETPGSRGAERMRKIESDLRAALKGKSE